MVKTVRAFFFAKFEGISRRFNLKGDQLIFEFYLDKKLER